MYYYNNDLPEELLLPRYISYDQFNCLAFAVGRYDDWLTLDRGLPKDIEPWNITNEVIEEALSYEFSYLDINARVIDSPYDVDEDEYLAILRYEPLENNSVPVEFHVIRQISDGRWYHKVGELPIQECYYSLDTKEGDCWFNFEEPENVSSDIYIAVKQSPKKYINRKIGYPIYNTKLYALYLPPTETPLPSSIRIPEDLKWYADYQEVKNLPNSDNGVILSTYFNRGIAVSEIESIDTSQVIICSVINHEYRLNHFTKRDGLICYDLDEIYTKVSDQNTIEAHTESSNTFKDTAENTIKGF